MQQSTEFQSIIDNLQKAAQYDQLKVPYLRSKQRYMEKLRNRNISIRAGYSVIDRSYRTNEGQCKFNRHNTLSHEVAKSKLMFMLMQLGYQAYSEVIFAGRKNIADIYLPEIMTVYEVLDSETMESFNEKVTSYPEEIEIIPLYAKDILGEAFTL